MLSKYMQTLVDSIGMPIVVIDTSNFKFVLSNKAAIEQFGGMDPVAESLFCYNVYRQKDSPCDDNTCPIRQLIATKEPTSCMFSCSECNIKSCDNLFFTPIFDRNSEVSLVLVTTKDIQDIKRTEESLQLFRYLIDKSNDGVLIIDPKTGRLLDVNKKICTDLGYTREELLTMGISDINAGIPDGRSFDILVDKAREKRHMVIETSYRHKDKTVITVEESLRFSTHEKREYMICIVRDVTRRKKAEKIMQDQKEFAASLVRYSTVPTFVIDAQHKILHWNKACEEITRINASEIVGTDIFYGSDLPSLADIVVSRELNENLRCDMKYSRSQYVSNGLHAENWVSNLGGKKRYVLFDAAPIYDSNDELVAALETMQDITEQKYAELTIKRKLEIEQAIASVSSLFIAPTDIDAAIDAALDEVGRLCGASRSYIFLFRENGTVMDNTHEWCNDGVESQKENLQNLPTNRYSWWMDKLYNAEGIHISDVYSLPPEASAERDIFEIQGIKSLLVLPMFSKGELMGYIGLDNVVNIGDWSEDNISILHMVSGVIGMAINRKRSEVAHRESEKRFRSLFENIPVAILEEDFSDVKTYIETLIWNEHIDDIETYLVQHPDVVSRCAGLMKILNVNQASLELHEASSKSELLENIEKTFTSKSYVTFCKELVAILKGETQMETEAFLQTLSGMPREVVVHWSVSPGHEKTLSRVLVSLIDITDRKRAEDNLKKYSEELQHSNELKDLFTDILHHDLLNPAGVIKGYTEILIDTEDNNEKEQYLQTIRRNNEKLISMIERASNFAKLESIEKLEFEKMDIVSIFKGVIENFRPHLEEKQMLIEFAADGEFCANVNLVIEEVFSNLLCNAIKYSPERGRIAVDILDAGDDWKVTVTDFGVGISDEDKSILFERFRRLKNGNVKGTGLGLAIVRRLTALHGGRVGVEDNPAGQGTVFWFTVKKA
jgi:PAS domain S-box-containing protein